MQPCVPSRACGGGHLEFQVILAQVCEDHAAQPSSDEEKEVKILLLVVFMALVLPNDVMMRDRLKNLQNATEEGRTVTMSSESISKAAAGGFVADENQDSVRCPACKKRVRADQIPATDMLRQHAVACPYPSLCSRSVSRDLLQQPPYRSLVEHLCQQWLTTKVTVALEMQFHPCLVLVALARRHLRRERAFPNAGVLVEALMDMEDPDIQRPPVLWDVAPVIRTLDSLKQQPLCHSEATGVSTRFEQRPVGTKVQNGPKYSENSPPNSLETPTPPPPSTHGKRNNKETLVEETMRLVYQWRCKNCGKVDADRLLTDCGHLSLCSDCLQRRSCCPICDVKITESIRVYAV